MVYHKKLTKKNHVILIHIFVNHPTFLKSGYSFNNLTRFTKYHTMEISGVLYNQLVYISYASVVRLH